MLHLEQLPKETEFSQVENVALTQEIDPQNLDSSLTLTQICK